VFCYLADSGHAPYGERPQDYVLGRCRRIARHLLQAEGCQGLVIACNTATAVAMRELRAWWPDVPIVGDEPGIKPASSLTSNRRIGVMATTATLRHRRFQALVRAHAPTASHRAAARASRWP
jgi:glutamate racemase